LFVAKALAEPKSNVLTHCNKAVTRAPWFLAAFFVDADDWDFSNVEAYIKQVAGPSALGGLNHQFRDQVALIDKYGIVTAETKWATKPRSRTRERNITAAER
jgi:hypothetical protein